MGQRCGRNSSNSSVEMMRLNVTDCVNVMEEGEPKTEGKEKTTLSSTWNWFLWFFSCIFPCLFPAPSSDEDRRYELPDAILQAHFEPHPQAPANPELQVAPQPEMFVEWCPNYLGEAFDRFKKRIEIVDSIPIIFIYPAWWDKVHPPAKEASSLEEAWSKRTTFKRWMTSPSKWVEFWFPVFLSGAPNEEERREEFIIEALESMEHRLISDLKQAILFRPHVGRISVDETIDDVSEPFLWYPEDLLEEETFRVFSCEESALNAINARINHLGLRVQDVAMYSELLPTQQAINRTNEFKVDEEVVGIIRRSSDAIHFARTVASSFVVRGYYLRSIPFRYYKIIVENINAPKERIGILRNWREFHEIGVEYGRTATGKKTYPDVSHPQVGFIDTEGGKQIEGRFREFVKEAKTLVRHRLMQNNA